MNAAQNEIQGISAVERALAAAGIVAGTTGAYMVWYFDPAQVNFLPVCPLYAFTGFACPGCGLTRGFHALFHGDLTTALDYNALIPLFAIIWGFFLVSMLSVAVRGRGIVKQAYLPKGMIGFLILLLVFGVVRNIPFYPFTLLYP